MNDIVPRFCNTLTADLHVTICTKTLHTNICFNNVNNKCVKIASSDSQIYACFMLHGINYMF